MTTWFAVTCTPSSVSLPFASAGGATIFTLARKSRSRSSKLKFAAVKVWDTSSVVVTVAVVAVGALLAAPTSKPLTPILNTASLA